MRVPTHIPNAAAPPAGPPTSSSIAPLMRFIAWPTSAAERPPSGNREPVVTCVARTASAMIAHDAVQDREPRGPIKATPFRFVSLDNAALAQAAFDELVRDPIH